MALKDMASLLIPQPESGSARNSDAAWSAKEWTHVYGFRKSYRATVLLNLERDDHDLDGEGFLRDYEITCNEAYCKLTAIYSTRASVLDPSTKPLEKPQYFRSSVQDNIPIERLPGYLAWWNYALSADSSITASDPPSWAKERKTTALSAAEGEHYQWIKDSSQLKQGWHVVLWPKFPGIDTKLNYHTIVRQVIWFDDITKAMKFGVTRVMRDAAGLKTWHNATGYWIALPTVCAPDGTLYRCETEWYCSEVEWPAEIYTAYLT